ncbi:hypothetical protein [uncultured Brevundimonas sp.]|uniref:hypothetical protein n=1 Tax=uncultured Brevundimonas sp. TaxID=213418 RepID=UPI0030ED1E4D|tara:strand:- start:1697 stop:2515 length:819 start_codon:yes stop_codon:yes gene_type:complete
MSKLVARAFEDTRRQLGGWPGLFMAVGAAVIAWFALGLIAGEEAMRAEAQFIVAALSGVGAVFLLMMLWNLICTPYRFAKEFAGEWREKAVISEGRVSALEDQIAALSDIRPVIRLTILGVVGGGSSVEMPGKVLLMPTVSVANIGRQPSALTDWKVEFGKNGSRSDADLFHARGVSFSRSEGPEGRVASEGFIYERTIAPVQPGAVVVGPIPTLVPPEVLRDPIGLDVWVSCFDVHGRRWEGHYSVQSDTIGPPRHHPGASISWEEIHGRE